MKKYYLVFAILLTLASCSSKNSSPTSNYNNTNNTGSFFVDWTIDNKHYNVTSDLSTIGTYSNHILAINAHPVADSTYPSLIVGVSSINGTGTYTWTPDNKISYSISWLAAAGAENYYSVNQLAVESSSSLTVTNFVTGSISGNFTGKLAKMVINGSSVTYQYININGTFKLPRAN